MRNNFQKLLLAISASSITAISVVDSEEAVAQQACNGTNTVRHTSYEEGVINVRTGYPETKHFDGQIHDGRGFVITRVEFINEFQFGSVSGPKKIEANSNVLIQDIFNETDKVLEENLKQTINPTVRN